MDLSSPGLMALGLVGRLAKFTGNGGSKMLADRPAADSKDVSALSQAGVPVVSLRDACAACDEPCDDDGDQANGESSGSVFRGLDVREHKATHGCASSNTKNVLVPHVFVALQVDMDSKLLGSLKGNSGRWIICATGKSGKLQGSCRKAGYPGKKELGDHVEGLQILETKRS